MHQPSWLEYSGGTHSTPAQSNCGSWFLFFFTLRQKKKSFIKMKIFQVKKKFVRVKKCKDWYLSPKKAVNRHRKLFHSRQGSRFTNKSAFAKGLQCYWFVSVLRISGQKKWYLTWNGHLAAVTDTLVGLIRMQNESGLGPAVPITATTDRGTVRNRNNSIKESAKMVSNVLNLKS